MAGETAREIITAIRADIDLAGDTLLAAAERGLREVGAVRAGDTLALDRLEEMLCAILEACAFQDLAGQRLSNLEVAVGDGGVLPEGADPLLNGPAAQGMGLDQAAADALMATPAT